MCVCQYNALRNSIRPVLQVRCEAWRGDGTWLARSPRGLRTLSSLVSGFKVLGYLECCFVSAVLLTL